MDYFDETMKKQQNLNIYYSILKEKKWINVLVDSIFKATKTIKSKEFRAINESDDHVW